MKDFIAKIAEENFFKNFKKLLKDFGAKIYADKSANI